MWVQVFSDLVSRHLCPLPSPCEWEGLSPPFHHFMSKHLQKLCWVLFLFWVLMSLDIFICLLALLWIASFFKSKLVSLDCYGPLEQKWVYPVFIMLWNVSTGKPSQGSELSVWLPSPFCSFFKILLEYSWFTMLYYLLLYSKVNQLYIYTDIYPLVLRFFSHVGHYRVLSRVSCAIQ